MEQLHLPWTWVHLGTRSLVPEGHEQSTSPLFEGMGLRKMLRLPTTSLATVSSYHGPLNRLGPPSWFSDPPATWHQPAGSLCVAPAHGQWDSSGMGRAGVFPSGQQGGDL